MSSTTYERFGEGLNGKARKVRKPVPVSANKVRHGITVGMGCGIPCLSLALSNIGGRLVGEGHGALGTGAMLLCCGVLAHLAWAVRGHHAVGLVAVLVSESRGD